MGLREFIVASIEAAGQSFEEGELAFLRSWQPSPDHLLRQSGRPWMTDQ